LIDKKTESERILTPVTSYTFNSDAISTTNRFLLLLRNSSISNGLLANDLNQNVELIQGPEKQISILNKSKFSGGMDVAVYNALGKLIYEQQTLSSYFVTKHCFESGLYLVVLRSGSTIISKKIVIK